MSAIKKSGHGDPPDWWKKGISGDDGERNYDRTAGAKLYTPSGCDHTCQRSDLTLSDGRVLYGGQGQKLSLPSTKVDHLDLIVDCAGLYQRTPFMKGIKGSPLSRRWAALKHVDRGPEVLRLDWPDMTAPTHVGIRFWSQLLKLLPQHTAVCCMGGHGRTGTALAALLIADGMDPSKAIVTVRNKHCAKAIETALQEAYLKALNG